jgi:transcriptional regulator with PAS, ATPase and Fis domain
MIAIFKYVEAISGSGEPILITGETGTGKELLAKAAHNVARPNGPFVAVNVAGLDDTMFTDTLFGHTRGAFTSASQVRKGLVEKAQGGTLFLDEIGDLDNSSQVKLLRLIQEKEYYPLGSDMPKCTDAHIVVATNKDLKKMMAEGTFRKDLFFRLAVHQINLPLLKNRRDDIPVLVHHFLAEAASTMGKTKPTPPKELFQLLDMYHFPGNLRELRSMVFDAVGQHQSRMLSLSTFKLHMGLKNSEITAPKDDSSQDTALLGSMEHLPTMREMEDILIREALERSRGNQSVAADMLGITRQTLCNRTRNKK